MKYLNVTVFLSLIVLVTGCQKKDQLPVEKTVQVDTAKKQKKPRLERRGATKMQTKPSTTKQSM